MRHVLDEYRAVGVAFNLAWSSALRSLPRSHPEIKEWKKALTWARPAFKAAYERGGIEVTHMDTEHSRLHFIEFEREPIGPLPVAA